MNPYPWILAVAIFAAGAAGGWAVADWKASGELATARAHTQAANLRNDALIGANNRCAVNVEDVRKAVKGIADQSARVAAAAAAEMKKAASQAQSHAARADEILSRPPVQQPKWCETIVRENAAYVAERRGLRMDPTLRSAP